MKNLALFKHVPPIARAVHHLAGKGGTAAACNVAPAPQDRQTAAGIGFSEEDEKRFIRYFGARPAQHIPHIAPANPGDRQPTIQSVDRARD